MIIVLFSKGCDSVICTCRYNGTVNDKDAQELLEKYPKAMYYEFFTEKEYKLRFE